MESKNRIFVTNEKQEYILVQLHNMVVMYKGSFGFVNPIPTKTDAMMTTTAADMDIAEPPAATGTIGPATLISILATGQIPSQMSKLGSLSALMVALPVNYTALILR